MTAVRARGSLQLRGCRLTPYIACSGKTECREIAEAAVPPRTAAGQRRARRSRDDRTGRPGPAERAIAGEITRTSVASVAARLRRARQTVW